VEDTSGATEEQRGSEAGGVPGYQANKELKVIRWTAVNDFLQKICIPDARPLDRVRLILIPLPSNADTADMKPKQGSVLTPNAGTLKEYEVSKVPSSYDSMLD
jgi:hypothetical protein